MTKKQKPRIVGLITVVPVILLAVIFFSMPCLLPAQHPDASNPTPTATPNSYTLDWQAIFGQAGVVGVLVWYLYYTTSMAFPKVRQDFRDELATERAHHESLMTEQRSQVTKLCDAFTRLSGELEKRPCIHKDYAKGVSP